jgi:hypothetical protein
MSSTAQLRIPEGAGVERHCSDCDRRQLRILNSTGTATRCNAHYKIKLSGELSTNLPSRRRLHLRCHGSWRQCANPPTHVLRFRIGHGSRLSQNTQSVKSILLFMHRVRPTYGNAFNVKKRSWNGTRWSTTLVIRPKSRLEDHVMESQRPNWKACCS